MNNNSNPVETNRVGIGVLVSVRDAGEAKHAVAAGVDILDVKEPLNGSLGMATADAMISVLEKTPDDACVSVALGELYQALDCPSRIIAMFDSLDNAESIRFAKIGLSMMRHRADWKQRWADVLKKLPASITAVGVVYADWEVADAPTPVEIIGAAAKLGCGAVLIDTYDKSNGDLFNHFDVHKLKVLKNLTQRFGMKFVMAGSINGHSLEKVADVCPDFVGIRGAVCDDSVRVNAVCLDRIVDFKEKLNRIESIRILN